MGVFLVVYERDRDLTGLINTALAQVQRYAYAVAYNSEGKYKLYLPTDANSTTADQCFVYNNIKNNWTRETRARVFSAVNAGSNAGLIRESDDTLMLAHADANTAQVAQERKTFAATDYSDIEGTDNITSSSGLTVNVSGGGEKVGDLLVQGASSAVVAAVNGTALTMQSVQIERSHREQRR